MFYQALLLSARVQSCELCLSVCRNNSLYYTSVVWFKSYTCLLVRCYTIARFAVIVDACVWTMLERKLMMIIMMIIGVANNRQEEAIASSWNLPNKKRPSWSIVWFAENQEEADRDMIAIRVESSCFPYLTNTVCGRDLLTYLQNCPKFSLFHTTFLQRGRIACNAVRCNSYGNSVRQSVRTSVTRWYCTQTNEDRIMRSSLWGRPNTVVFWHQ